MKNKKLLLLIRGIETGEILPVPFNWEYYQMPTSEYICGFIQAAIKSDWPKIHIMTVLDSILYKGHSPAIECFKLICIIPKS